MDDAVELLPLRMVNEFVYCPRLFWLEYVGREFADSHDTVDGQRVHRNVDRPSATPLSSDEEFVGEVRSVTLSSPKLGIVGKLDIVEGEGGEVFPVDYKRGRVPAVPGGAYDPERVQVFLQGLLLQEAGYRCERGFIYYSDSRRRVEVTFDDSLRELALSSVAKAQRTGESATIPPPLIDSPKCPRCSLVGICLPDESNVLTNRLDQSRVRPLVVAQDIATPLYVISPGAHVGKSEDILQIRRGREVVDEVRLLDVAHVSLFGNVQISTQALRALFDRGIPTFYFSYGVWLSGMSIPASGHSLDARIAQHRLADDPGRRLALAKAIVTGKIRNQRTLVRRSLTDSAKKELGYLAFCARQSERAPSDEVLLGFEGTAARTYFECFAKMLRGPMSFDFNGRNRRPPKDPVNAALSFAYALLVRDCVAALLAVGLDPALGMYHRLRAGRPSLALDLAEEFRPLIADSVVLSACNTGELEPGHFVAAGIGVALNEQGRRAMIGAYERRLGGTVVHPLFGYSLSYRRVVAIQARLLARFFERDIPTYPPFMTR